MLVVKRSTQSFYELAVEKAVEHVLAGLDGALDLEGLARLAGLSPFHFHRIFRGMVGETPLELHRRLRLERAAWALLHSEQPVTRIAFEAGYETHESFTRAFRKHYDCSPSEFRLGRDAAARTCSPAYRVELAARSGIHFERPSLEVLRLRFEGGPVMNVEIKQRPELRVVTVSHVGPYNRIATAFARLGAVAGPAGLFGPDAAMIAIYLDDPETTPTSELRSEAALSVAPDAPLPAELGERRLAAGRYACAVHVGPYEQLGDTWARLMGEWLPRSGERIADGVSYEVYRNTPETAPPERLETELYLPLVS